MREYFGNLLLTFSEMVLGRPACSIYRRAHHYEGYRADGYRGNSPFLKVTPIKEYTLHIIVKNEHPYKGFAEHYLIVPRREINSLLEFTPEEGKELIHIMGEYEALGYEIVSQQFGPSSRGTIFHKHVHLLK